MINDMDLKQKLRIMRFWWYNGYFSRLNVDIFRYEHGEKTSQQYTDVDVLGIKFQENFMSSMAICDCKSGQVNKKDRIFWISGLMKYLGADHGIFVTKDIDESRYYDLGKSFNILTISEKRLSELENIYKLNTKPIVGPFDYENITIVQKIFDNLKNDLKNVYNYLKYKYWIELPHKQITSLMKCLKDIENHNFKKIEEKHFLLIYCLALFSISLLHFSEPLLILPSAKREKYVKESLLGGEIESYKMKELFRSFYRFMVAEIKKKYNKRYPLSEKQFVEFLYNSESKYLVDLIDRLLINPIEAIQTPRLLDIIAYEVILKGENSGINEKIFSYNNRFDVLNVLKLTKDLLTYCKRADLVSTDTKDLIVNNYIDPLYNNKKPPVQKKLVD